MAFCSQCGANVPENVNQCPQCGAAMNAAPQNNIPQGNPYQAYPQGTAPTGQMNTGLLVWSIISLVLCCLPLGIVALVFTINAKNAPTAEEEAKKLQTAKICNIVSLVLGVVGIILYFTVFAAIIGGAMASLA